jgi:hypothetical protein
MRACEGCRRRKIKCDAATTNAWPCAACIRLKLNCVPPIVEDYFSDDSEGGSIPFEGRRSLRRGRIRKDMRSRRSSLHSPPNWLLFLRHNLPAEAKPQLLVETRKTTNKVPPRKRSVNQFNTPRNSQLAVGASSGSPPTNLMI